MTTKSIYKFILPIVTFLYSISIPAATFIGNRTDFRDETIYFVMTTRFYDGDPSNNTQCWDNQQANQGDPAWRGDFKGLIEKLDYIKALGYRYSTVAAITTSVFDMKVPEKKKGIIDKASDEVIAIERKYNRGILTDD